MNDYTRTIIATTAARKAAKKDSDKVAAYTAARKAFRAAIASRKAAKAAKAAAKAAAKVGIVTVVSSDRMSNRQYHFSGKKTWWLRQGSTFVQIPWTRGDKQFEATLKLEDGSYVLGVGPNNKHGIRQSIVVAGGKLV